MKSRILRIAVGLVLAGSATYAGDYLSILYRARSGRDPYASVAIHSYYAIHEKNGRTEYDFAEPQIEMCVRSLFPHSGYRPCWYVNRHTEQKIDI